jgi:hypothetical protein
MVFYFPPIPPPSVTVLKPNNSNLFTLPWYDWFRKWTQWATDVELVLTAVTTESSGVYFPTIDGSLSNPTVTYSHQEGYWIRIGDMVTFHAHLIVSTYSGGTGTARITLPLVAHTVPGPGNYDPTLPAFTSDVDWGTGKQFLYARVIDGTSLADFISVGNNAAAVLLAMNAFSAGSEISVSATYWTDAP